RRGGPRGADVGGAGVWRASIHAGIAGDLDGLVGGVVHGPLVYRTKSRRLLDIRALRYSPGNPAARSRLLVSAHARRTFGDRALVVARLFQRHRPSDHHSVG